jgi:DNA-binding protein H-NS
VANLAMTMAVENLKQIAAEYTELEQQLTEKRQQRDRAIRDALQYIPMLRIVKIVHLSREQLYRIKGAPDQ